MSAFGGIFLKIKVENFRALFWARSLNRFFQRALPLLLIGILSGFQCRVRYAKFAMLQTSKPHAVKGAGVNFLCLRFANWTRRHREFSLMGAAHDYTPVQSGECHSIINTCLPRRSQALREVLYA